ncbi:MAG: type II secretion system F family protein [Candidatus Sericytochromatia bacterium]|nr:type II secretion system F family protein [Candidatus Sericytochromatia bacterium]
MPLAPRQLGSFYAQFGRLLRSGLPPAAALTSLAKGRWPPALRGVLTGLTNQVSRGGALAEELSRQTPIIPSFDAEWLAAAEASGRTSDGLEVLASRHWQRHETSVALLKKGIYPLLMLSAAALLAPLQLVFEGQWGAYARAAGQPLLGLYAGVFGSYWLALAPVALPLRKGLARAAASLPFVGSALRQQAIAHLGLLLGTCLGAGLSMSKTFALAAHNLADPGLRRACQAVEAEVQRGISLTDAMRQHPQAFPDEMLSVIETGEAAGRLDEALETASEVWKEDGDRAAARLIAVAAGALTAVAMGLMGWLIYRLASGFLHTVEQLT